MLQQFGENHAHPHRGCFDRLSDGDRAGADEQLAVTAGPNGTTVVNGKPCRVVTGDAGGSNSTTITAGPNGVSGSTTMSPSGSRSSVIVSSGSSGGTSSSAAGSDCVIYRPAK
jgi:hypothetical protein